MNRKKQVTMREIDNLIGAEPFKVLAKKISESKEEVQDVFLTNYLLLSDAGEGLKTISSLYHKLLLEQNLLPEESKTHIANNLYGETIHYKSDIKFLQTLTEAIQNQVVYTNKFKGIVAIDINNYPVGEKNKIKADFLTLLAHNKNNISFFLRIDRSKEKLLTQYMSELNASGNIYLLESPSLTAEDFRPFCKNFLEKYYTVNEENITKVSNSIYKLSKEQLLSGFSGAEKFLKDLRLYIHYQREELSLDERINYYINNILPMKYNKQDNETIGFTSETEETF
ncbi:MAG: hypothetical protein ACRCUS_02010 [Anaerovoracaceae bacterium]